MVYNQLPEENSNTRYNCCLLFFATLLSSTDSTSSSCCNKTNLSASTCSSLDGRCFTDVLMVTTTMWMFYGVHCHTTYFRPAITLNLILVIGTSSFQHRFVNTTSTAHNSNCCTIS